MFHYTGNVQNTTGDALAGYYVKLSDPTNGATIPIYSDVSGTPIVTASGLANAAKADNSGRISFWVTEGLYNVNTYRGDGITLVWSDMGVSFGALGPTGLFTAISSLIVPIGTDRIRTSGRSVVGRYGASYILDADQTTNTTIGQSYIDAVTSAEGAPAGVLAQTAVRAILDRVRIQTANGRWFVIDDDAQEVHAGHFGAVGDAVFAWTSPTFTGTDNAAAIQAMIDWRMYLRTGTISAYKDCILPPGAFRINKGLQLGYGDTFRTVTMRGDGKGYFNLAGGSTLVCDFDDHPAISIQGGRNSYVSDIQIIAPRGSSYFYTKQLRDYSNGAMINFSIDDRDLSQWVDPAYPTRSPLLRYNPFCAIAIDPYAGVQPVAATAWAVSTVTAIGAYKTANSKLFIAQTAGTTASSGVGPNATAGDIIDGTVTWNYVGPSTLSTSYPAATAPLFLPLAKRPTYGRSFSSNFPIRNVSLVGFAVGVAIQPCDADGNGDFGLLDDCEISVSAIQLSIGNTQARNNGAHRLVGSVFHTAITTNKHGRQNGKMGGVFTNCAWSSCHQLIDIGATSIVGPHKFISCYVEDCYRLGSATGGGTSGTTIAWDNCQFGFSHFVTNNQRGVPQTVMAGSGTFSSTHTFDNCIFTGFSGFLTMMAQGIKLTNCSLQDTTFGVAASSQARARAYNSSGGGLAIPNWRNGHDHIVKYSPYNETTLAIANVISTGRMSKDSSRDIPASIYTPSLMPYAGAREEIIAPLYVATLDKTTLSASRTGRTLTITTTFTDASSWQYNLVVGSLLWDDTDNSTYIVLSRTGASGAYVFVCELQNGWRLNGAGAIITEKTYAATGNFYVVDGGLFTPPYPTYGDFIGSGATISNAQRLDGVSVNIIASVAVNDRPYVDPYGAVDFYVGLKVASGTATSLTFNSGLGTFTQTKRRLPLFLRGTV